MPISKAQIIDDIILELTQGSPSDDLEISIPQVAFWASTNLNALVTTECNSKTAKGESIPSIYIRKASCEVLTLEEDGCEDCQDRVYVELDEEVLTLNNDAGILVVQTDQGDSVLKASVESLNLYNRMRFAKPSENNLVYSHEGTKIYVNGLKESDIPFDQLNVWYVPKQDLTLLEDADEVLVSDLVLPELIASVVQTGKLQIYGTQIDKENDGVPGTEPVYHKEIANPTK